MKNMKKSKKIVALIVVIAMAIALIPVMALAAGDITGSIGTEATNTPPTIVSVVIKDTTSGTADMGVGNPVTTQFSPQSYYDVEITVGDVDTVDDVELIDFSIWHTEVADDPTVTAFHALNPIAAKDGFNIVWDKTVDETLLDYEQTNTWDAVTTPPYMIYPMNETEKGYGTFTYVFRFQVGKIAVETSTGNDVDKWVFAVEVWDASDASAYETTSIDYGMDFFGEASLVPGHTVSWTDIGADQNYDDIGNATNAELIDPAGDKLICISNGGYDVGIKAETTWNSTSTADTITRDQGILGANEFGLGINTTDTWGTGGIDVLFDNNPDTSVSFLAAQEATSEIGQEVSGYFLFIATNATFPVDQTFTGTVTFDIVNDD